MINDPVVKYQLVKHTFVNLEYKVQGLLYAFYVLRDQESNWKWLNIYKVFFLSIWTFSR